MSTYFHCPCGRRLRAALATDGAVDCPACGRSVVLAEPRKDRRILWLALLPAVAIAVAAVGVFGIVIGTNLAARNSPPTPVAVAAVEATATPTTQPSPPRTSAPVGPEIAPAPRPVRPKAPVPQPVVVAPPMVVPGPPRVGVLQASVDPAGRYKVGDVVDQDVVFTRKSSFRIVGTEVGQGAQYAFSSSIAITKVNADGSLVAEQTIVKTKLIDADPDLKASLAAALDKAQGMKFELAVAQNGDVTSLKGLKDPLRVLAGKDAAAGQSLRLWSLLDADAWKELAGLTFFQPEKPLKAKVTWNKPVTHDWGPLGSWRGRTVYVAAGKQAVKPNLERIDYGHEIYYKPPLAGADRDLPIRVMKAEFQTAGAGGAILYDAATHRSTVAEETFRVRGAVQVSLAGTDAVIEMEEQQGFRLTMQEPAKRAMVGQPPLSRPK